MKFRVWLAAVTVLAPFAAGAQVLRGTVVDQGAQPVANAVVMLVDSSAAVSARSFTNERGEFRLLAPRAGTFRVRTLRIGYRPETSEPVTLRLGAETAQQFKLTGAAFSLDTLRVVSRNVCRSFTDSGAATFAVWEQVRAALTAAQMTNSARLIAVTSVTFERAIDPERHRVRRQTQAVRSGIAVQPWRAASPDSLHRLGYVVTDADKATNYFAPGLDMLLSDVFIADHCFRLTTDKDRLGIVFEPTPDRRNTAEIRGTLWLDRASAELRSMELRYVNVDSWQEQEAASQMEFARLRLGGWIISRWNIQMPVLEQVVRTQRLGGNQIRVAELQMTGGEVVLAMRGRDTMWAQPPRVLAGRVLDSLSGDGLAGSRVRVAGTGLDGIADEKGRFRIAGLLPGEYELEVRTASLDSVSVVHRADLTFMEASEAHDVRVPNAAQIVASVCGGESRRIPGIVFGRVRMRDDAPLPGPVAIFASWEEARAAVAQKLETHADPSGGFKLCGVPSGTAITLHAESDSADAEPLAASVAAAGGFARVEILLDRSTRAVGVFSGVVMVDSTKQPIVGAEVILPQIGRSVLTNERGAFRIPDVPAGEQQVAVRHLGYGPLDAQLTFAAHRTLEKQIYLSKVATIAEMNVTARAVLPSFEEHRRMALGHFLTREELAKQEGRKLSEILQQLPGVNVLAGTSSHAWITNNRGVRGGGQAVVDKADMNLGALPGKCYAQVYLDRSLVYRSSGNRNTPEPLFDINSLPAAQIEAIEYYAGPAEIPAMYSGQNVNCGVIVIWTRRTM